MFYILAKKYLQGACHLSCLVALLKKLLNTAYQQQSNIILV